MDIRVEDGEPDERDGTAKEEGSVDAPDQPDDEYMVARKKRQRLMEQADSFLKGGRPLTKEEEDEEPWINVQK